MPEVMKETIAARQPFLRLLTTKPLKLSNTPCMAARCARR